MTRMRPKEMRVPHQRVSRWSSNLTPGSGNRTQKVNASPVSRTTAGSFQSTPKKACSVGTTQGNSKISPRTNDQDLRNTKKKRSDDPNRTRETSENFPEKLVGPFPLVPVQTEGVYTKALLDTGAQVTLLYRDFYDKHLGHIPIRKLEELEIWGIETTRCPYDGYIPIQISFGQQLWGKKRLSTCWLSCVPDPQGLGRIPYW